MSLEDAINNHAAAVRELAAAMRGGAPVAAAPAAAAQSAQSAPAGTANGEQAPAGAGTAGEPGKAPARRRSTAAAPSAAPTATSAAPAPAPAPAPSSAGPKNPPPSELVQIRDLLLGAPKDVVDDLLSKYTPPGTRPALGAVHSSNYGALLADVTAWKNGGAVDDLSLDDDPARDPLDLG